MSAHRPSNTQLVGELIATGALPIVDAAFLKAPPHPAPAPVAPDRIAGMLLGLAIGDALGNTTEGLLPGERRRRYGELRDYLPHRHAGGRAVGLPSDDTQLAFWTLEQLLVDDGCVPEHVAARLCQGPIFGIGAAVSEFVANHRAGRKPWYSCGAPSAGNGALMRIAPLVLPHLATSSPTLWADTALAALITHRDAASIAASVAMADLLWQLLHRASTPEPAWWLQRYVATARQLEGQTSYRPRGGAFRSYAGPCWQFAAEHVAAADRAGLTVLDACNGWYSGAYLLETVPSVLYILTRYGHDPEAALVRAVNDTKDNDTVAAIVGAALGALHGAAAWPERWRAGLLGRTTADDDGYVFTLIAQAAGRWAAPAPA